MAAPELARLPLAPSPGAGLMPFPSSVRARMLVLILLAAVPLFGMAASIAWQNYRMVAERPRQQATLLLTAAGARNEAVLDQAARLLDGLSASPAVQAGGAACADALDQTMRLFGDRYQQLAVFDAGGRQRCDSTRATHAALGDSPAVRSLLAQVRSTHRFEVGEVVGSPVPGRPELTVAGSLAGEGGFAGILLAVLRVDWLGMPTSPGLTAPQGASWLVGADKRTMVEVGRAGAQSGGAATTQASAAQPAPDTLKALLAVAEAGPRIATGALGMPYAYAAARLRGGVMLLVGVPAAAEIGRADAVLGRRLAELGLLLLAGLVAVALGGRLLLVQPVKALSRAVRLWRDGGRFDPGPLDGAPAEICELAATFDQASAALRTRETELREASVRQDLLMQEIHHRVKNNLQIVASLLNLQASRIKLPEARAEFAAARDRIRALATLHRHLYAHDELHTINMRSFLAELCEQLFQAIGETPAGGRINLHIDAPELQISSDQAVPIALIVTEAVSNAAKYAFPGGRSGHIRVRLETMSGIVAAAPPVGGTEPLQGARLSIEDDGVGIPAGRTETEAGVRDGIGITLIRGFARQLGATLTVSHDGGTQYAIDIPLRNAHGEQRDPAHLED